MQARWEDPFEYSTAGGMVGLGCQVDGVTLSESIDRDCRAMIRGICEAGERRGR